MKCPNCGGEIEENSKFCGYCGRNIENEKESLNMNFQGMEEVTLNSNGEIELKKAKQDKSSKIWICLVAALVIIIGIVIAILFSSKSSKIETNSLEKLEKSLGNIKQIVDTSGTVNASIIIESQNEQKASTSSTNVKYQKNKDEFKLEINASSSMLEDKIELFGKGNDNDLTLYINSNLIKMLIPTIELDYDTKWLYYKLDLTDYKDSLEDLIAEEDETIDLKELDIEENIKYVGEEKGLKHYTLEINQELIKKLQLNDFTEDVEIPVVLDVEDDFESISVDFYLNKSDNLEKISVDLTKYFDDEEITKALITIEIKDINKTTVTIPKELDDAISLETYLNSIELNDSKDYNY